MPKESKQLNKFNVGTVLNASERDLNGDAASYSLNVDPLTKEGILDGIPTDSFVTSLGGGSARLLESVHWNFASNSTSKFNVDNIRDFAGERVTKFSATGSLGILETLVTSEVYPSLERVHVKETPPGRDFTLTPITVGTGSADVNIGAGNIDKVRLGMTVTSGDATNSINPGTYILAIATPNITLSQNPLVSATVTLAFTETEYLVYKPSAAIGADIRIDHTQNDDSGTTRDLSTYLNEGDYIQFDDVSNRDIFSSTDEVMKITNIDDTYLYLDRQYLGSLSSTLTSGKFYHIKSNRASFFDIQSSTSKGELVNVTGWSNNAGNHLGGNGFKRADGSATDTLEINCADHTVTITANQIAIDIDGANYPNVSRYIAEGDVFHLYGNPVTNNHAKSFKVIDSDINRTVASKEVIRLSSDTPAVAETLTSGKIYLEADKIKNFAFEFVNAANEYVAQDWKETELSESNSRNLLKSISGSDNANINLVESGGPRNADTTSYPYQATHNYATIASSYFNTGLTIRDAMTEVQTFANFSTLVAQYFNPGDIILIGSELMKVTSVENYSIGLERAIYSSTVSAPSASTAVHKNKFNSIYQNISKDHLSAGQEYELSFFARAVTTTAGAGSICVNSSSNPHLNHDSRRISLESTEGTKISYRFDTSGTWATSELSGAEVRFTGDTTTSAADKLLLAYYANYHDKTLQLKSTDGTSITYTFDAAEPARAFGTDIVSHLGAVAVMKFSNSNFCTENAGPHIVSDPAFFGVEYLTTTDCNNLNGKRFGINSSDGTTKYYEFSTSSGSFGPGSDGSTDVKFMLLNPLAFGAGSGSDSVTGVQISSLITTMSNAINNETHGHGAADGDRLRVSYFQITTEVGDDDQIRNYIKITNNIRIDGSDGDEVTNPNCAVNATDGNRAIITGDDTDNGVDVSYMHWLLPDETFGYTTHTLFTGHDASDIAFRSANNADAANKIGLTPHNPGGGGTVPADVTEADLTFHQIQGGFTTELQARDFMGTVIDRVETFHADKIKGYIKDKHDESSASGILTQVVPGPGGYTNITTNVASQYLNIPSRFEIGGDTAVDISDVSNTNEIAIELANAINGATGHGSTTGGGTALITAGTPSTGDFTITQNIGGSGGNTEIISDISRTYVAPDFDDTLGLDAIAQIKLDLDGKSFDSSGDLFYDTTGSGVGDSLKDILNTNTWIDLKTLIKPDGDTSSCESSIDANWRKFSLRFTIPKGTDISNGLDLYFASTGYAASAIGIADVSLVEKSIISETDESKGTITASGIVDNKGEKDLVVYDSSKNKIRVIKDFDTNKKVNLFSDILEKSDKASEIVASKNKIASFASKNREVHVGFGPEESDTSPLWVGYLNQRVFGQPIEDDLYMDNDGVPQYDLKGVNNISKIALAGEHECLIGTTSTTTATGDTIEIVHAAHGLTSDNVGDNIIIREWLDADNSWLGSGVWMVSSIEDVDTFKAMRPLVDVPHGTNAEYKICWRPYYYYGCRRGDSSIYRIFPDTRITTTTAADTLDTFYKKGKVEKSISLGFPIVSLCTSYNKESDGTGGGELYLLSELGDSVHRIKVDAIPYNKWTDFEIPISKTQDIVYKSFKWSNDDLTGDIGGTTAVFETKAAESSPTITPAGLVSDILETKAPNETFDWDEDTATPATTSSAFDTRLWIQHYPTADKSTFGEGDRFLFAARSGGDYSGHTELNSGTLYFGDRTPPTNVLYGKEIRYTYGGAKFRAAPGERPAGDGDNGVHTGISNTELGKHSLYYYYLDDKNDERKDKLERWSYVYDDKGASDGTGGFFQCQRGTKFGYQSFGHNCGWQGNGGNKPSIKVIPYGLFPIADNDGDGVIDGTGLVVPNNETLESGKLRYGNYHQRVCGHVVGIIGGSERKWIRNWGKVSGQTGGYAVSRRKTGHSDAPEDMSVTKCVFVCPDIHFGDSPTSGYYKITAIEEESTTPYYTRLTISSVDGSTPNLQGGEIVYPTSNGGTQSQGHLSDTGWGKACHIVYVKSSTSIVIPVKYSQFTGSSISGSNPGKLYVHGFKNPGRCYMSPNLEIGTSGSLFKVNKQHYHYAFKSDDPLNKEAFNNGHYGPTFYTPQNTIGEARYSDYENSDNVFYAPGYQGKVDRLSYLSGRMIRPFNMDDASFQDLEIGKNIAVDMPCAPDVIYRKAGGAKVWKSDGDVDDLFASKLFISASKDPSTFGEVNDSKIWAVEWNNMYPDTSLAVDIQGNGSNTTSSFNNAKFSNITVAGTVSDYFITVAGGGDNYNRQDAPFHPEVEVYTHDGAATDISYPSGYSIFPGGAAGKTTFHRTHGVWAGYCISIIDAITGMVQTRYIVDSYSDGTYPFLQTNKMRFMVHYPFGHAPADLDKFYIWKSSLAATAPVRLFKEKSLPYGLGSMMNADPVVNQRIYNAGGFLSTNDGTTTVTIYTRESALSSATLVPNLLKIGDIIEISETENQLYDGVHEVSSLIGLYTFTIILPEAVETGAISTGIWKLADVANSTSSVANPITVPMVSPKIKATFGGLDMRKTKSATITGIGEGGGEASDMTVTCSANHPFDIGDTTTIVSTSNPTSQSGTYIVDADNGTTTFDVTNTVVTTSAGFAYSNQWELYLSSSSSQAKTGELRAGLNAWDKGNIKSNVSRHDYLASDEQEVFSSVSGGSISVTPSSIANQTGDFFKKNTTYRYKIALVYDGYQDGPLTSNSWSYIDTATRAKLKITLSVSSFSKRLSAIKLYRKDFELDNYKLVKNISTKSGWTFEDGSWTYRIEDGGEVGATYDAETGMSELMETFSVKYGISTEIDGYLFVGDCSHTEIVNASNLIFRSKRGQFSLFDWVHDYQRLRSKPTAMANFLGRLYVFDDNNTYKINPQTLAIEDVFEGAGCSSQNSLVITEFGMFFASKNGAYYHDGSMPKKISTPIQKGGENDMLTISNSTTIGSTPVKDISWDNTVGAIGNAHPYIIFDSKRNCVLFMVEFKEKEAHSLTDSETVQTYSPSFTYYTWSYNIDAGRWDLWQLTDGVKIGKPFTGKNGEILVSMGSSIYEYLGGSKKRPFTWISKKLTLDEDSRYKVFTKVKIVGPTEDLNIGGEYNNDSDRLIIATDKGRITSGNDSTTKYITYSQDSTDGADYKLSGPNRKGKWMQFSLENMTDAVDSVSLLFRRRPIK